MMNFCKIEFLAVSENESFARIAAAAFASLIDPTLEELSDIKTAVSEAVTNAIIHGYDSEGGKVVMKMSIKDNIIEISVSDKGRGIEDIKKAMQPLYTSKPHLERSGMGFTVMETFMDSLKVISEPGAGTEVIMTKKIEHGKPV